MDQYYNMAQGSSYHFGPTVTYIYFISRYLQLYGLWALHGATSILLSNYTQGTAKYINNKVAR
jgi:hypothetical protein